MRRFSKPRQAVIRQVRHICCTALTLGALAAPAAKAADFPVKPIQLVIPAPAGGAIDQLVRVLAPKFQTLLGGSTVVVNRGGAGGLIAAQSVKRAAPDGYTLLVHVDSVYVYPIFVKTDFDAEKDLTPISMFAESPYFIVANSKFPATTLAGLIDYAKSARGKLNLAVQPNTRPYLQTVGLVKAAGIEAGLIPYTGGAPIATALLAGEVHAYVGSPTPVIELVRAGQLRLLAVGGSRRLAEFPQAGLASEAKVAGVEFDDFSTWYGFFGPSGLPEPVLRKLSDAVVNTVKDPETAAQIRRLGSEPTPLGYQEFSSLVGRIMVSLKAAAQSAKIAPP